jgi:hypothetical protein
MLMERCAAAPGQGAQINEGSSTMTPDNEKLLKLMRFWLVGTFVIVWTAITIYIGLFTSRNWMQAIQLGFPIWGITAVLCAIWYFGYKAWLTRKKA